MLSKIKLGILDFRQGLSWHDAWLHMAWQEIKLRYKGSTLGPFWLTASTLIQIMTLGFLYPRIFHVNSSEYIIWLTASLITWQFIAGSITESCVVFSSNRKFYMDQRIPYSFFCYKHVIMSFYVFIHQIPIYFVAMFFLGVHISLFSFITFLVSTSIVLFFILNVSIILGMLCLRYQDMSQIVGHIMNIAFLVTPVIWMPKMLGNKIAILEWNPFYYLISIIRLPLLNQPVEPRLWLGILAMLSLLSLISLISFSKFRRLIIFW